MSTTDLVIKNLATPKSETTNMSVREVLEPPGVAAKPAKKGVRFWLIFLAVCMSLFLSAMDFTAVSTTLPTIVSDLNGEDFVWVASAYALASTALLPASGAMAQVFGRRITILSAIALFALGSALCGAAQSMNWLIAARTVQGAGGGAILCTASIIVSDLVPLNERALYNGFIGFTWAIAAIVGPLVGGAFAQEGQWRWLFYLNLPICGVSAALVAFFLNLKTPRGSFWSKISRMDWIGNFLVIGSSSAVIIALSWGGVKFSWSSANVLAPLLIGLAGLALFLLYDGMIAKEPLVPFSIISNRTSLSGYLQTLISPIAQVGTLYFMPVYYQACYGSTPIQSGAYLLSFLAVAGLFLVLSAVTVTVTQRYRPQLWFGWACCVANAAALSTLDADSPKSASIGYPVFMGLATGTIFAIAYFPVLAPLDVSQNARALSFFAFCRSFGNVWAVAIGTAVLQTQLTLRLPVDFVDKLPKGVALFYTVIPQIAKLPEPLRTTVRVAYADSLRVFWQVMIGISGLGFLSSLMMKGLPLHKKVDDKWGMEKKNLTPQRRMTIASEEMQLTELPRDEA